MPGRNQEAGSSDRPAIIAYNTALARPTWYWAWKDLVFAALPGGHDRTELIGRSLGSLLGTASWNGRLDRGVCGITDDSNDDGFFYDFNQRIKSINRNCTMLMYVGADAVETTSRGISIPSHSVWSTPFMDLAFEFRTSGSRCRYVYASSTSANHNAESATNFFSSAPALLGITRNGAAVRFYRNGLLHSTATITNNDQFFNDEQPVTLFNRSSTSALQGVQGRVALAMIYARTLTDSEMGALGGDPFGPFRVFFLEDIGLASGVPNISYQSTGHIGALGLSIVTSDRIVTPTGHIGSFGDADGDHAASAQVAGHAGALGAGIITRDAIAAPEGHAGAHGQTVATGAANVVAEGHVGAFGLCRKFLGIVFNPRRWGFFNFFRRRGR